MRLIDTIRKIRKSFSGYNPSVRVLISKTNLLYNLNEYKKHYSHFLFAPVLKSNAYGHGLTEVAQILDKEKKAFFVVDSLYEAMILRNKEIKSPLLIIGYTSPNNINTCKLSHVAFTVTGLEHLEKITRTIKRKTNIHLKIDTGMHRKGILLNQISASINIIKAHKFLSLEGICSHLADADNPDEINTKLQIEQWGNAIKVFKSNFKDIKYFHVSATAGARYSDLTHSNVIRLGLGLYGINNDPKTEIDLKPVLQLQSTISSVKTIPIGEHVGYGFTYKTSKDTRIATIPVGYFEGVDRRLSNCGVVEIKNTFCPIVGSISMNITSIDVSSVPKITIDEVATIISDDSSDPNSVLNIAKLAHTIPYEILIHIPQHLRRIITTE